MERNTTAVVATAVTAVICGCPGTLALFTGALVSLISYIPGAEIDIFGDTSQRAALNFGWSVLCIGFLLVLTPIVVALLTFRRREPAVRTFEEPLPPPS